MTSRTAYSMDFAFSHFDGNPAVAMSGRFLYADAPRIHDLIAQWDYQRSPSMTLDLHYVTFIDSSAIGMLFLLANRAKEAGGRLTLRNVAPSVRKVLERADISFQGIIL